MCGIFFSIGFENLPDQVIDSVAHRGPDGRGWNDFTCSKGPIVMAHRRLAIIDLSADGHQPMSIQGGRYWITYNGEIYNYLEIRAELEHAGYHFVTKTDTEVLLQSYLNWGAECLHKFNGMFAFVIWDTQANTFFAARDRFGVKPLYYYQYGSKIAFASEIKQFKHLPGWRFALNTSLAAFYNIRGYCDHLSETLYQNVFQVLPGHFISTDAQAFEIVPVKWYALKDRVRPLRLSDSDACEQFKAFFSDAVRVRLRSDVAVGACLSGGLDSSSIVSMIRHLDPSREIHAFSAVFPGHPVDESRYIEALSSQKHIISHKNYPTRESFLEQLDDLLYHQDLPFPGTSIFAQWTTFKDAQSKGLTVLLDGQGADESLLGYPGMLNGIIFDYMKRMDFKGLGLFLKWQKNYNAQSARNTFLLGLQQRFSSLYRGLLRFSGRKVSPESISPSLKNMTETCLWHLSNPFQSLLRYEDRNSMAFSVESRLPFLDYRLVEFVLSLGVEQRFRADQTKWVLRQAMKEINFNEILERKDKIGFATPEKEWFENERESSYVSNFIFERWVSATNYIK